MGFYSYLTIYWYTFSNMLCLLLFPSACPFPPSFSLPAGYLLSFPDRPFLSPIHCLLSNSTRSRLRVKAREFVLIIVLSVNVV